MIRTIIPIISTLIPIISSPFSRLSVPLFRLSVPRCRDFGRDYQYFRKVVAVRPKPCGARLVRVRAREMSWKPVQYPSHTPSTLGGGRGMIQSDQRRKRRARQADDRRQRRAPTRKPGGRKDLPQLGVDRGIRCLVGHVGHAGGRDTMPRGIPRRQPCQGRAGCVASARAHCAVVHAIADKSAILIVIIHPSGHRWALMRC